MAIRLEQAEIEQYLALEQERQSAQRIADAKKRAGERLKEKIRTYVEENGGARRTTTHYGYVLSLRPYRKQQVPWKDEFIEIAGDEKAVELQEAQPMTYSLSVEPAATSS